MFLTSLGKLSWEKYSSCDHVLEALDFIINILVIDNVCPITPQRLIYSPCQQHLLACTECLLLELYLPLTFLLLQHVTFLHFELFCEQMEHAKCMKCRSADSTHTVRQQSITKTCSRAGHAQTSSLFFVSQKTSEASLDEPTGMRICFLLSSMPWPA